MQKLKLSEKPQSGINLIEASAGTGKTFSIANLYLHFVLQGKKVSEILVVTFTEAATKELRERIRENLREALSILNDSSTEDSVIKEILALYPQSEDLLKKAILCFDQAAIFTIHSFCRRTLQENAFESSALFDADLQQDSSALLNETVNDFWRQNIYPLSSEEMANLNIKRQDLHQLLRQLMQNPELKLKGTISEQEWQKAQSEHKQLKEKCQVALSLLEDSEDDIKALLLNGSLSKATYKEATFPDRIKQLKSCLKNGQEIPFNSKKESIVKYFGSYSQKAKKGCDAPQHAFFKACEQLEEIQWPNLSLLFSLYLKGLFSTEAQDRLTQIKDRQNILTFDDLILELHRAVHNEESSALVRCIRDKYKIALVDEFQDTDPKQYEIFDRIFGDNSTRHSFYMIGDPKQSIYAFRGADIFAYLIAKNKADHQFTLDTNYRSEPGMVDAVNSFFLQKSSDQNYASQQAFAFPASEGKQGIAFDPVLSGSKGRELKEMARTQAALQLRWFHDLEENKKGIAKGNLNPIIYRDCCNEIIKLLNQSQAGELKFEQVKNAEDESFRPGDIAILTKNNKQASSFKKMLNQHGIPAVVQKSGNVFHSPEAHNLLLWLNAVIEPKDVNITPLLLSSFFSLSAQEFKDRSDNEALMFLQDLLDYQVQWERRGILRSLQRFFEQQDIVTKTLQGQNGDRAYSNYLQLREILHDLEQTEGLGLSALTRFLNQKIHSNDEQEEYLQRLETDANAVQIMTIHKSKGLEFPVVFCPFTWSESFKESTSHLSPSYSKNDFGFHCEKEQSIVYHLHIEADDREESRWQWRREELGEQLRLLYVALTRSANRCYLYSGDINNDASLFSYLADPHFSAAQVNSGELPHLDPEARRRAWQDLAKSNQNISFELFDHEVKVSKSLYSEESQPFLEEPDLAPAIQQTWRVGSYSSLTKMHPQSSYIPENAPTKYDDDQGLSEAERQSLENEIEAAGIFAFPRGANPGTAMHEIFEFIDFQDEKYWDQTILKVLQKYSLSHHGDTDLTQERLEVLKEMLRSVLHTELLPTAIQQQGIENFALKSLRRDQRIDEMEFYCPIKNISQNDLAAVFNKHYPQGHENAVYAFDIQKLKYQMEEGFLTGSIDLAFEKNGRYYVLDWKSNHLGNQVANYHQEALKAKVCESYYFLQYHLYTLALHLFLESSMKDDYHYESHFGGCIYAFIRGFSPGKNFGIHWDRVPYGLVQDMKELLIKGTDLQIIKQGAQ